MIEIHEEKNKVSCKQGYNMYTGDTCSNSIIMCVLLNQVDAGIFRMLWLSFEKEKNLTGSTFVRKDGCNTANTYDLHQGQ